MPFERWRQALSTASHRQIDKVLARSDGAAVHETVFCREMGLSVLDTYATRIQLRKTLLRHGCRRIGGGFWTMTTSDHR